MHKLKHKYTNNKITIIGTLTHTINIIHRNTEFILEISEQDILLVKLYYTVWKYRKLVVT